MRHRVDGRKFGRNTSHRKAMFKNLAIALINNERITTTLAKAKELRRVADRLVTMAKKDSVHHRRLAFAKLRDKAAVEKLFNVMSDRYKSRAGGYTRILKVGETRLGDAAKMAMIEMVDAPIKVSEESKRSLRKRRREKKQEEAEKAAAEQQ